MNQSDLKSRKSKSDEEKVITFSFILSLLKGWATIFLLALFIIHFTSSNTICTIENEVLNQTKTITKWELGTEVPIEYSLLNLKRTYRIDLWKLEHPNEVIICKAQNPLKSITNQQELTELNNILKEKQLTINSTYMNYLVDSTAITTS